ncbi:MAG: flagellar basal body-associated FliL family protein [Gammaproteobacteria bacterium]|nr:flagellar basal body-associated FliL family protein [Gammaproteobacteria bacterium]
MKKLLPFILGAIALASTSGLVTMILMGGANGGAPPPQEAVAAAAPPPPPLYHELKDFTMNFVGPKGKTRYMQVSFSILTRSPEEITALEQHAPAIQNNILLKLSGRDGEDLMTPEGKDALRKEALAIIKETLTTQEGKESVEDLFVTKLVMQ